MPQQHSLFASQIQYFTAFQIIMVMNNSMSSYDDEELCKRLQELIEKPLTIEDDTDFDTDENHFDNNPTTKTLEDI